MALLDILTLLKSILGNIGALSGALVSIGIIYVWIKKPINIFSKYNNAVNLSAEHEKRLDSIEPILDKLSKTMEQHDIDTMRSAIITFAMDLKRGENKSEIEFKYNLDLCQRYSHDNNGYIMSYIKYIHDKHEETQGIA